MNCALVVLVATVVLAPTFGPARGQPPSAEDRPPAWKLLFSDSRDVCDTWGELRFGVTPVRRIRDGEAPGFDVEAGFVPRLETPPLVIDGTLLFPRGGMLLGLPEDRISCVAARANAEFSTRPFTMPDADLLLNAALPSPERPFAKDSAYAMVAVLDEKGAAIAGFEGEKRVIRSQDRRDIPLRGGSVSARTLAGRTIRLGFHLRSASLCAVTAGTTP